MRIPGYTADSVLLDNTSKRNYQNASRFPGANKEKVLPQISAVSCRCEPDCNSHLLGSVVCTWRDPVLGVRREHQWWNECQLDISRFKVSRCYPHPFLGCIADRSILLANGQWQNCEPSRCPPEICENRWATAHPLIQFR